jgi:hypothetical protein
LWLAAGTPRRWLAPGEAIEVRQGASYFGPVSYRLEAREDGVDARVTLPERNPPKTAWLVLRAPLGKHVRSVEVDGREWTDFDPKLEGIKLPIHAGEIRIAARF